MNILQQLSHSIPTNATLVVGFSGGPDSVALLHALHSVAPDNNLTLIAVHVDHEWRTDSAADATWCLKFCRELGIKGIAVRGSTVTITQPDSGSKEDRGRQLRRTVFAKYVDQYDAQGIVLAHHADDQEENFFVRLLRGSSVHGLAGIAEQNGDYIRPLLTRRKAELIDYCETNNLSYLTDPTNASPEHLRNRVRHSVIPALRAADERLSTTLHRTINQLRHSSEYIEREAQRALVTVTNDTSLDLKAFANLDPFLQREVLIRWLYAHEVPFTQSEGFIDELMRFLDSPRGGTHDTHTTWSLNKRQNVASIIYR